MPRGLHRGLTRFALAVSVRDTLTGRVVVWPEGTAELRIETETGEQAATGVVEAGGDFQVPLPAPVPDTVELLLLSGLLTDTVSG